VGRLEAQVALVTGAASGIGYATALRFAQEGAIVVGFDRNECAEWQVVEEAATKSSYVVGDVTDEAAIAELVSGIVDGYGSLDVAVNAAGITGGGPVHLVTLEDWNRIINVNLTGTFLVGKYATGQMMNQPNGGSIVNVASIEGVTGTEGGSSYSASKGAVVILTKNMAIDYGRRGIRGNAVCPGFIDTPLMRATFDSPGMAPARERYREEHKLGRFGRPEEIASAALFLASEDASFVTGHALVVDGGFTAGMRAGVLEVLGL
jgi:NAD(P)-dependent dehydrogenase (short-subunit alcohol dehydrogenase family)